MVAKVIQFRVAIPAHCESGQTIRIHCPDGTEANVKIPNALSSGDEFIFELPSNHMRNPRALFDQQQSRSVTTTTTRSNINEEGMGKKKDSSNCKKYSAAATAADIVVTRNVTQIETASSLFGGKSFLEREINTLQDFFLALSVGLLVGSSIVLGFLLGVLHVTSKFPLEDHSASSVDNTMNDCDGGDAGGRETTQKVSEALNILMS